MQDKMTYPTFEPFIKPNGSFNTVGSITNVLIILFIWVIANNTALLLYNYLWREPRREERLRVVRHLLAQTEEAEQSELLHALPAVWYPARRIERNETMQRFNEVPPEGRQEWLLDMCSAGICYTVWHLSRRSLRIDEYRILDHLEEKLHQYQRKYYTFPADRGSFLGIVEREENIRRWHKEHPVLNGLTVFGLYHKPGITTVHIHLSVSNILEEVQLYRKKSRAEGNIPDQMV